MPVHTLQFILENDTLCKGPHFRSRGRLQDDVIQTFEQRCGLETHSSHSS